MRADLFVFLVLLVVSLSLFIYLFVWSLRQIGDNKGYAQVYESGDMLARTHRGFKFASFLLSLSFIALYVVLGLRELRMVFLEYLIVAFVTVGTKGIMSAKISKKNFKSERQKFVVKSIFLISICTYFWTTILWIAYIIFLYV